MAKQTYTLGTVAASEQLLRDLYLDLRVKIVNWAQVTHQTAQARMGYVGQHLVSVVTNCPGGKSGARGKDLIHADGTHGEIKTCYRVDQLGHCTACEARVASIENNCPNCGSREINRMDDSKWLIGIQHDKEFAEILDPKLYYLVLFDFVDLHKPTVIRASIWTVVPTTPGFAYCMIDYYYNIRAKSKSKAPFNLWPYSLKFYAMRPCLIYQSLLHDDGTIDTKLFPGRDDAQESPLEQLQSYSQSRNLTIGGTRQLGELLGCDSLPSGTKAEVLAAIQKSIIARNVRNAKVADAVSTVLYGDRIQPHKPLLPKRHKHLLGFH